MARHTATQQLRYTDPMDVHLHLLPMPVNHLLLDDDTVTIAQVILNLIVLECRARSSRLS